MVIAVAMPLIVGAVDATTGVVSDFFDPRHLAYPLGWLFAAGWSLLFSVPIAVGVGLITALLRRRGQGAGAAEIATNHGSG